MSAGPNDSVDMFQSTLEAERSNTPEGVQDQTAGSRDTVVPPSSSARSPRGEREKRQASVSGPEESAAASSGPGPDSEIVKVFFLNVFGQFVWIGG